MSVAPPLQGEGIYVASNLCVYISPQAGEGRRNDYERLCVRVFLRSF